MLKVKPSGFADESDAGVTARKESGNQGFVGLSNSKDRVAMNRDEKKNLREDQIWLKVRQDREIQMDAR